MAQTTFWCDEMLQPVPEKRGGDAPQAPASASAARPPAAPLSDFAVEVSEGPWLRCLPSWASLGFCTVVACVLGFGLGYGCNSLDACDEDWQKIIKFPGELWVRALRMLVTPLMCSIMVVVPNQAADLGTLGVRACSFYIFTSAIAALEGIMWVNVLQPGVGVHLDTPSADIPENASELDTLDTILNLGRQVVPSNIVRATLELQVLGILTVFGGFGMLLRRVPEEQRRIVLSLASAVVRCTMLAVGHFIRLTPLGMASTVAGAVAGTDRLSESLQALAKYCATVLLGHMLHAAVFYAVLHWLFAAWVFRRAGHSWTTSLSRFSPFSSEGFYARAWAIKDAPLTAFATSSSAATLPVTLRTNLAHGIPAPLAEFVLPLGAAVNLDGTALGFPIMVMFGAQLFDYTVPWANQLAVACVGVICSIGAAPIPNAGIVYLVLLLSTAGGVLTEEHTQATIIAMVLVLDWFVDRVETTANVFSDSTIVHLLHLWSQSDEQMQLTSSKTAGQPEQLAEPNEHEEVTTV